MEPQKGSWFKVLIAIFVVVASVSISYYFFVFLPHQKTAEQSLAQQQKCADDSMKLFEKLGYKVNSLDGFINHWNQKLGKCFVSIITSTSISMSDSLQDAYEGKMYGLYMTSFDDKSIGLKMIGCEMYPDGNQSSYKACNSKEEYDAFVDSYLNN